jgi:hypothetical protein
MVLRRRLAALLMSAASSIAPAGTEADGDAARPAETGVASPNTGGHGTPTPAPATPPELAQDAAMRALLETCARAFVPSGQGVRANVMTFTPDRLRRTVNRATAFNMAGDPDAGLTIDATAGASGKAVLLRRAAVADLTLLQITSVPPWGLTADQQARVRPRLKSILSVPIFNPANANGPLLATLQVDSDLSVEELAFNRPEAAELMQQFADVLSLMMIGIDVRLGQIDNVTASPAMSHSRVHNATQVEPGMYVANASTSIFLMSRTRDAWP